MVPDSEGAGFAARGYDRYAGRTRRATTTRLLGPQPPILFVWNYTVQGRPILTRLVRITPPPVLSRLSPPTVITIPQPFVARPVDTTFVPSPLNARKPFSHLPDVIYKPRVYTGIQGRLTPPRATNPTVRSRLIRPIFQPQISRIYGVLTPPRSTNPTVRSRLSLTTVTAAADLLYSAFVTFAYSSRGTPKSRLFPPSVVGTPEPYLRPIDTTFAYSSRGTPKSRLPQVAVQGVEPLARPTVTKVVRIPPQTDDRRAAHPKLPTYIVAAVILPEIDGYLTPPRSTTWPFRSKLNPPAVVKAPFVAAPIATTLAYQRRGLAKSRLSNFVVPSIILPEIDGYLTPPRSMSWPTRSKLSPPAPDFRVAFVATPIAATLTYSLAGKPKPRLYPPVVVGPVLAKPIDTTFAPSPLAARKPFSRLQDPAVVDQALTSVPPSVTALAYSSRGLAKSRLRGPTVVGLVLARPTLLHLAYSSRGTAKPRLLPPAVVAPILARPELVHLAYSSRGTAKSRLRLPSVVSPVLAAPTATTFARIRPAAVHSILRRPTDLVDQQDVGAVSATLAYSVRGNPKSRLQKPVAVGPVLAPPTLTSLAYSSRGKPKSKLHSPTAVGPVLSRRRIEHLAYSVRGVAKSRLGIPSKFAAQPRAVTVLLVHLAYSLRGKPKSRLQGPTVVTPAAAFLRPIDTTLVRIRPPATIARLRRPTDTTGIEDQGSVAVTLAYSSRGKPKSKLSLPTRVAPVLARTIDTPFAYQSRGKPKSRLRPPAVVGQVLARPTLVSLAPSHGGVTHSIVRPPALLPGLPRAILTVLSPSSRCLAKSVLLPPTVLGVPSAGTLSTTFATIKPPPVHSRLTLTAIVQPTPTSVTISTTFARIRPRPTLTILRPGVVIHPCFGVGIGTITAAADNAIVDAPVAQSSSSIVAGAAAAGSITAPSTIGTARPSAENDISDEQREGC